MSEEKKSNNIMVRIATFIVDKRKAFLILFVLAGIYCALSVSKVKVNDDLTTYLPQTTETRQGLTIMEDEFITFGTAKVMVTNVTYEKALELAHHMEEIKGVTGVQFYDWDDDTYDESDLADYYKNSAALYNITFDGEEDAEISQNAMLEIRDYLSPYDTYVYSTVGKDDSKDLQNDISQIMVVVIIIIVGVLLFTSKTYIEVVIFLMVFGMAAILNMGTNYWFGEISFVTNAVGTILQLALGIDYAIILCHRFMEERETKETREAIITALSKAIPEISSSSLTTVSGLVALMLMQFRIGLDLGQVLTKAIIISLLTVFLFMPALIVMFSKLIDKTRHRNFVPSIRAWGTFVIKTRYVLVPLFLVVLAAGCYLSSKCAYVYDNNSIVSKKKTEYVIAREKIEANFGTSNVMAVVVPKGDYKKEAAILAHLETIERVDYALGLSNVEVDEDNGYVLTDSLNPRQLSETADVDIDLVRLLYRAYAIDKGEYAAFMGSIDDYKIPIISTVTFLYDQKEKGALNLEEDLSDTVDDLYEQIHDAQLQMEGENYSRMIFALTGPVEGQETFDIIDDIRTEASRYYDEVYVVGDSTSDYDLSKSFLNDNRKISVITALFVGIILLFTFQSAGLPFMLVLTIQGSIWINFSVPPLMDSTMFFLSYLIVSAIQMGATIDYAIVITSRYMELRNFMERKEAVVETLNQAFPTIVTSGSILTCAGFVIGQSTSNATIASLGSTLGRGTLISIILVMTVLPQILLIGDWLIEKTAFTIHKPEEDNRKLRNGKVKIDGYVKGYISGEIDGKISGTVDGEINALIKNISSANVREEENVDEED